MRFSNVHYPFFRFSRFYCIVIFGWFGVSLLSARTFYHLMLLMRGILLHICVRVVCGVVCGLFNSHHFQSIRTHQRWRPLVAIVWNGLGDDVFVVVDVVVVIIILWCFKSAIKSNRSNNKQQKWHNQNEIASLVPSHSSAPSLSRPIHSYSHRVRK